MLSLEFSHVPKMLQVVDTGWETGRVGFQLCPLEPLMPTTFVFTHYFTGYALDSTVVGLPDSLLLFPDAPLLH